MMRPDIALIHLDSVRRGLTRQLERPNPGWTESERAVEHSRLQAQLAAITVASTYLDLAAMHVDPLVAALAVRMIRDPALLGLVLTGARQWPVAGLSLNDLYLQAQDEVQETQEWLAEERADGVDHPESRRWLELEKYQAAVVALAHLLNQETQEREAATFAEQEGVTIRHLNLP
jgi:hypothetical protein